jgi:hypothetical protein
MPDLGDLPWCLANNDPSAGPDWQWRSSASDNSITVDVMPTFSDTATAVMITAEHSTTGDNPAGCS